MLGLLLLAGCVTPAAPPPATSPATAAFPLTIVDDEGTSVTLTAEPQRVISLSPANTETVFALGEGDKLVGGTDFDDYPAEAVALPDVATFEGVLIEQVVDLEPDVVLAAGNGFNPVADIERLRELEIPVVVLYAETVDEVLTDIELIGQAVGAADEAAEITSTMATRMAEITADVDSAGSRPRVFYQIGSEPEIYGPADDSFIADMIELAGGEAITTGSSSAFSIPLERLVDADPEVIILGDASYGVTPEDVKSRPGGWAEMTAVKEDSVRPVDDTIVTRPGPRLADGLAALALAIHPDLDLPEASPAP